VVDVDEDGRLVEGALAGPALGAEGTTPTYGSSPYAWTGFYAGLSAGYDWNLRTPLSAISNIGEFGSKGGSIGATLGFDYQFAPRWVVGAAVDLNLEGMEAVMDANPSGAPAHAGSLRRQDCLREHRRRRWPSRTARG
jgi:opacity protein-like surface antigen